MGSSTVKLPPLPPGFRLDSGPPPPPPPGFVLDQSPPAAVPERDWAKREGERRQTELLSESARTGVAHPYRAFVEQFAPNVVSDIRGGINSLKDPLNAAATVASLHPVGRAIVAPIAIAGGAAELASAKPDIRYEGIANRPETLGFSANPEKTQKALLAGSAIAGGGAGVKEGAPRYRAAINKAGEAGQATSRALYQSALKPPPGSNTGAEVTRVVETGLKEGFPVSNAGAKKLSGLLDNLQAKVAAEIQSNPNAPINPKAVAGRLSSTKTRFSNQVAPMEDLAAITATEREFLAQHPGTIPAEQAQALKTGTYKQLKSKAYGELKTARVESEKALARGLKEEINQIFPKLKELNAREAEAYNLQPELERAIRRIGNHDILGLSTYGAAAVGGLATGETALAGAGASGLLARILGDPAVKSRIAIMLYKASSKMRKP